MSSAKPRHRAREVGRGDGGFTEKAALTQNKARDSLVALCNVK